MRSSSLGGEGENQVEHQELLQTFAEVAVAFAGFSAVVSIFDRRAADDDPRIRHYRVRVMVEYSVCVAMFSFVPYLLNALLGSDVVAWRISSALLAITWSVVGLSAARRARQIFGRSALSVAPTFSTISNLLGYSGAAILVLNAMGFPLRSSGASYIVGLFLPLLQSALYFLRMIVRGDPLRESAPAPDALQPWHTIWQRIVDKW
jgi:hypothetical protein